MSDEHHAFSDIIALWPAPGALADDIGVSEHRVRKWRERDSIPGEWFAAVASAARSRGIGGVTAETMASVAQRRRQRQDGDAA